MTATSGMENAVGSGKISTRDDRLHRGRKVTSAFLMQGWGQFLNVVILMLILFLANGSSSDPPYSIKAVQLAFRLSFAIPAVGTAVLVWQRMFRMKDANKAVEEQKRKNVEIGEQDEWIAQRLRRRLCVAVFK